MKEILENLPTPLELITHPTTLIIVGMYVGLMLWEAMFPARQLPKMKYWKIKGIASFVLFYFLSSYLPLIWDNYLIEYQVFNLTSLGTLGGAIVGFVIYQMGIYTWHRTMHKNDILWKTFHQMHHSNERLDSYSAFYFSPLDMIGFTFVGSLTLVLVAGFTPQATTLILLVTTFFAIFQHSNIKTPVWLGYIVQRPEAHTMHHAKGIHAYNYCDLSLIDMLFGTFRNPKKHEYETGFYIGGSNRIIDMLLFKDINKK